MTKFFIAANSAAVAFSGRSANQPSQAAHEQEQRQHGQIFLRDGPDFAISRHACSIVGTKLGKLLTLIQGPVTVAALLVTEPTPFDIVTE